MLLEFPRVAILLLTASLWPVTRVSKADHDHLGDVVIEDRTHIRVGCSSLSEFCSALRSGQKSAEFSHLTQTQIQCLPFPAIFEYNQQPFLAHSVCVC